MLGLLALAASLLALGGGHRDGRLALTIGESSDPHPGQLAVMDGDGSHFRALPGEMQLWPAWSPDGRLIAFDDVYDIDVVAPDSSAKPRVLLRKASNPAWSPSGRTLAFVRHNEIWLLDMASHRQRRLVRHGLAPHWFADGKTVAFARGNDIWAVDVASRAARRLIRNGHYPRPSPDGRWIAFERWHTDPCCGVTTSILVARADGSAPRRLAGGFAPAWSPDSREIAFVGTAARRHFADAVIRMKLDGSDRRVLFGRRPYCGCAGVDWTR